MVHNCTALWNWASYQIRKIAGCACAGNAGNVFPRRRLQRKPLVSDPDMHHGTCVTHVPWCMSGSLTRGGEENVPGIPGACAPTILRIWQEVHTAQSSTVDFWNRCWRNNTRFPKLWAVTGPYNSTFHIACCWHDKNLVRNLHCKLNSVTATIILGTKYVQNKISYVYIYSTAMVVILGSTTQIDFRFKFKCFIFPTEIHII